MPKKGRLARLLARLPAWVFTQPVPSVRQIYDACMELGIYPDVFLPFELVEELESRMEWLAEHPRQCPPVVRSWRIPRTTAPSNADAEDVIEWAQHLNDRKWRWER